MLLIAAAATVMLALAAPASNAARARGAVTPTRGDLAAGALAPSPRGSGRALGLRAPADHTEASPVCLLDWCPPPVVVPGMAGDAASGAAARASRTELFLSLLDRADLGLVSSVARFLVETGLRVEWTPASLDRSSGAAGGAGKVMVGVRMRLDAWNLPALRSTEDPAGRASGHTGG